MTKAFVRIRAAFLVDGEELWAELIDAVLWDRVFLDTELGVERLPMR